MPGAGFQSKARFWRDAVMEMRDAPFESVLNSLVKFSFFILVTLFALTSSINVEIGNCQAVFRH